MAYSQRIPKHQIEVLAWLGQKNWISLTQDGFSIPRDIQTLVEKSMQVSRTFAREVQQIIMIVVRWHHANGDDLFRLNDHLHWLFMSSQVLATGQKTIQLSSDWCEAFENTELTLEFKDYRQPFRTMVVELPANYVETKYVTGLDEYPEFIAVHHEEKEQVLLFVIGMKTGCVTYRYLYNLEDSVESCCHQLLDHSFVSPDLGITEGMNATSQLLRIVLNATVAMTYGADWQKLEPTNNEKQVIKNLKKQIHAKGRKESSEAMKARLRLGMMPEVFQFDQKIKAFEDHRTDSNTHSEHNGTPKRPHFRKGHWRQQAVGHGRTQRKPTWIPPMLINAGQFKGDLKDTTTTYTTS